MKTIDKYQFNEQLVHYFDGIETFLTFHTELKKYFTLKRLDINKNFQQSLYSYLMNQSSILKKIQHDNVYKCHKLFKTKNNLYLIYDDVLNAESIEKTIKSLKFENSTKLSIVRQISSVLFQMSKAAIVHLTLNVKNVVLLPDQTIKIINFGHSITLPHNKSSIELQKIISVKNNFIAPEIFEGVGHKKSDIYSFGVIINYLFEKQFQYRNKGKKDSSSKEQKLSKQYWVDKLYDLINKMTLSNPEERINIVDVDQILNSRDKAGQMDKSQISYTTTVGLDKETYTILIKKSSKKSNDGTNPSTILAPNAATKQAVNQESMKDRNIEFIMKVVLKRRNLAYAFLDMAFACSTNKQVKIRTCVILAFLLIKKATVVISQLTKFLKTGRAGDLIIDSRINEDLNKTPEYLKITPIIHRQMGQMQQKFLDLLEEVKKTPECTSDLNLKEEVRCQKINNEYLKKCAFEFLSQLQLEPCQQYCSNYEKKELIRIYLLSLLYKHDTFQLIYEELFSSNTTHLDQEPLIQQLMSFDKEIIVNFISMNRSIRKEVNQEYNKLRSLPTIQ